MIAHLHPDMVIYSTGTADDLFVLSNNYLKAPDELSVGLRNSFFAVMVHGVAGAAVPGSVGDEQVSWYFADLAERIRHAYKYEGKNRAILMLSCYTGFGMARPLALNLKLPVVAGRSAVTIEASGAIKCVQMSQESRNSFNSGLQVGNRLDWVFTSPSGQIEISKAAALDKRAAISFAAKFKT